MIIKLLTQTLSTGHSETARAEIAAVEAMHGCSSCIKENLLATASLLSGNLGNSVICKFGSLADLPRPQDVIHARRFFSSLKISCPCTPDSLI